MAENREKRKANSIKANASALRILGACIFVVLIFSAGFLLRGNNDFMTALGFPSLTSNNSLSATSDSTVNKADTVASRIAEVETILNEESVSGYDLDAATNTIVQELVNSTNDPYLHYYTPLDYQNYLSQNSEPGAGIGILFGEYEGHCYVTDIYENSEASHSGIEIGDYIVSIDGETKNVWTINEVTNALNRGDGEVVHITWCHPESLDSEGGREYSTNIAYVKSDEANVTTELHGHVGYISIKQITNDSASSVKEAIKDLTSRGASSFALDLRNVAGGYLTQALEIGSAFVSSGTLVQIKTADSTSGRNADGNVVTDAPIVVIVNGYTSGSAEVLAAALQDSGRASILGETTLGKGTVQVIQPLSFGGAIRYTAATYLTPTGRTIDGNGVRPDFPVANVDRQKSIAIEFASSGATR